jgi:2-dehydro-3-deoxyphosphogluconate aldolase / (4S)-4-hydroxy-2-oxoglutarate aldolase
VSLTDDGATVARADQMAIRVTECGLVAIVRCGSPAEAVEQGTMLLEAGAAVVEVSLVTPGAVAVVTELRSAFPDALIGTGTVTSVREAAASIDAGAEILVSPIVDAGVIAAGRAADVLVIPGACTPTECVTAVRLGARLVKLFPASVYSPSALKDVLTSLPQLRLVPTGGVQLSQAERWFGAGAAALGVGSALASLAPPEAARQIAAVGDAKRRAGTGH